MNNENERSVIPASRSIAGMTIFYAGITFLGKMP